MKNEESRISILDFSDLIRDFYIITNHEEAILNMFSEIYKIFNMDKLTLIAYNEDFNSYSKIYEFKKQSEFNLTSKIIDIDINQCINPLHFNSNEHQNNFRKLCSTEHYIYTDNFLDVKSIFENVGFSPENFKEIHEIYAFSNSSKSLFAYCIFEKYSTEKLSNSDIKLITTLCDIINSSIQEIVKTKYFETDILIKNTILNYEEIPIAVVEKGTFKILYHNEYYYKVFPTIEIGGICYELMGNKEKCKDCCIDKNVIMNNKWIKKAIPFKISNNKEAYMIYAKDNTDYLSQLNAFDKLTETLLFRGFEEYYKNFIQRSNDTYALCSLDIDKFKYINNVFGYDVGDDVLKKVADVIRNFLGVHENFSRIGEDKFSVFLHYNSEEELHLRVRILSNKFNEMKAEHFPDARITIIGGVTFVDKNLTINSLLDQTTTARKTAKGSHKNKFSYYDPKIDIKVKEDLRIEEMIPYALENDEFEAYLQPKFDLQTKKICGAESLVRWKTPNGMIFPDQFIPLFERNGFILTLDFIMYEKVMKFIRKCLDENLPVYPISVNVSRNHIKDKNFLIKFMDLIKKYQVPCEYLELEITESVFVEDKNILKKFIDEIKAQNLKISIDDFGTAYSSLQTLTDINIDVLKIDKGFLDNIVIQDNVSQKSESVLKNETLLKNIILIKNIINLAKELEFKVICEGVETDGQIELLKNIGCELGQGYVFAKPMPIDDYTNKYIL